MKSPFTIVMVLFSLLGISQESDTMRVENDLQGDWEFQYYLYPDGEKKLLRYGPQENDSSLVILDVHFNKRQIYFAHSAKLGSSPLYGSEGSWYFYDSEEGIFIYIEGFDTPLWGEYEIKSVDNRTLVFTECDKDEYCRELYFLKKETK